MCLGQRRFKTGHCVQRGLPHCGNGCDARRIRSWIAAEIELSATERTREPVKAALADLDTTLRLLMLDSPTSPDLGAVQQAIRDIEAIDARQEAEIQSVAGLLTRQ